MFFISVSEEKSRKVLRDISELKTVESWLKKRSTILPFEIPSDVKVSNVNYVSYVPQYTDVSQNLPVSLQPFKMSDFKDAEVSEWG